MAAINQNIFGYMPVESVDWAKGMNSLSATIGGIGERREQEKEYLDKLKFDNTRTIQQSDAFSSQTFGQMMLASSQEGVTTIKAWNDALKRGELDPKQYKQNMNNLMESWGTLGNSIKSFDAKNAELQKKLQDGTASKASVEAAQYFARVGDLKNMKVFIDPSNGNVSTGRLDPKTGQVIPDSIDSAKTGADPSNAVFDKVNLDEAVSETTSLWKDYVVERNLTTISDLRENPMFAAKMADLKGALTSNDRLTLSILQDNTDGGYSTYYTNEDRIALIGQMVDRENEIRSYQGKAQLNDTELQEFLSNADKKLIPMKKDPSGVYQPMITQEQRDEAKKAIDNSVALQLGFKVTEDEPIRPSGGNTTTPKEEKPEYYAFASKVLNSWIDGDVNKLNTLSGGKWLFEKTGKGTYMIINSTNPKDVRGPFNEINDVGPFFGINQEQWGKKMGKAWEANGGNPSKNNTSNSGINWSNGKKG
jgi:hypothetical protein